jgi:hypothetical protein
MSVQCHWCKGEFIRFHKWLPDNPKNRWDTVELCVRCFAEAKTTGRKARKAPPRFPGARPQTETKAERTTDVMMGVTISQLEARRARWARIQRYSDA